MVVGGGISQRAQDGRNVRMGLDTWEQLLIVKTNILDFGRQAYLTKFGQIQGARCRICLWLVRRNRNAIAYIDPHQGIDVTLLCLRNIDEGAYLAEPFQDGLIGSQCVALVCECKV